jgi:hypothetical protein
MNRTEDEFVERWYDRLLGMALRGLVADDDEVPKGPAARGAFARKLPEKVEQLLRQQYRDLMKDTKPLANGQPVQPARKA